MTQESEPAEELKLFFGLDNLRSLVLPSVEIRPLTIIVGNNNIGKSTLLRSFPLIKQSVAQSNRPIIWKNSLVDFGNFNTAVNNKHPEQGITFEFGAENLSVHSNILRTIYDEQYVRDGQVKIDGCVKAKITLHEGVFAGRTTKIELPNHKIELSVTSGPNSKFEDIKLGNKNLSPRFGDIDFHLPEGHILSKFEPESIADKNRLTDISDYELMFLSGLVDILSLNYHDKLDDQQIIHEALSILEEPSLDKRNLSELEKATEFEPLKQIYSEFINQGSSIYHELNEITMLHTAILAFNYLSDYFYSLISNLSYFKPTRAVSDRFFPNDDKEDLNVIEVSPEGKNLSSFLATVSEKNEIQKFSDWMKKYFDYGIQVQVGDTHTSIIVDGNQGPVNLTDSGYGISETLPFLAQLWWESHISAKSLGSMSESSEDFTSHYSDNLNNYKLIAIEQPELHLHPKHQAALAKIFADTITNGDSADHIKPMYIVETHSSALVNALGELIEDKYIDPNKIQILVFDPKDDDSKTVGVKEAYFSKKGHLRDWPYGFFRYSK